MCTDSMKRILTTSIPILEGARMGSQKKRRWGEQERNVVGIEFREDKGPKLREPPPKQNA